MRPLVAMGLTALLVTSGCATAPTYIPPDDDVDARIEALMAEYNAASVGVGIIRGGKLVWTGYYGEESRGVPVTAISMFNTASTNKSITAELALRLASEGLIDLDEPVAPYYEHPDVKDDPRYAKLTPRLLLSHQAGFLNWAHVYDDGKLAFIDEPGNGNYNYAGIGVRIFARFVEAKLGKPFPQLVKEYVFDPIGMTRATNAHNVVDRLDNVVMPVNPNGEFLKVRALWEGYWSAADDLFISVEDHAKFLIATMNNDGVNKAMAKERLTLQTDITDHTIWGCGPDYVDPCPEPYGHSIGWYLFGYGDRLVVHHGGNDQSEGAIGYYEPATGNGGVIFVNTTRGVELWPLIADVVDPEQPMQDVFHDVIRRYITNAGDNN
ncbi:MAG: serine hydrolase domain-containing protein [Pseudomonadota bacterium]